MPRYGQGMDIQRTRASARITPTDSGWILILDIHGPRVTIGDEAPFHYGRWEFDSILWMVLDTRV